MTAKNSHTAGSIRDQWAAQQRGAHYVQPGLIPSAEIADPQDRQASEHRHDSPNASLGVDVSDDDVSPTHFSRGVRLSSDALPYSRFDMTGKYVSGSIAQSNGATAPAEGLRPFFVYAIACIVVTFLWFAWTQLTTDGSVMGSSAHFTVGMAILVLILLSGVIAGVVTALRSRGRGSADTSTLFALAFGKTALAMLVAVIVWFVCILVAAN